MTREAFDMMRTIRIFCECAAAGGQKHIQLMNHMIKTDPRKLTFLWDKIIYLIFKIDLCLIKMIQTIY